MKKNNASHVFLTVFCFLLITVFFAGAGFTQNKEEGAPLYKFSYVQVKPGMEIDFYDFIKSKIPFFKKMGITDLTIFKTSIFGTPGKYLLVTPLQSPEAADAELARDESLIPVEVVPILSGLNRTIVSSHDFLLMPQEDFNIPPPDDYAFKIVISLTIGTVPGSDKDFKKTLKKIVNALGKGNPKGVLVGKVGFGGDLDEYIIFGLHDSFKDIAAGTAIVQKEMEPVNTKTLMKMIKYRKSEIFVRIPELCITPGTN